LTAGKTAAVAASSGLMPAARSDIPTVAILPFANATGKGPALAQVINTLKS
jgi:hypothetical protein